MNTQSKTNRDSSVIISIDWGNVFFGSLIDWENSFGAKPSLDDDQLVDYIYDWCYDEGLDIELLSVSDEEFLFESLMTLKNNILSKYYEKRKAFISKNKIENDLVLELIEAEFNNRRC